MGLALTILSCYLFNFLSLALMSLVALQGYWPFQVLKANHATLALLAIIIYLFTQSLIIFYFTGMGVNIRDYVKEHQLDPTLLNRSKAIKMTLFPKILINIGLFMAVFILGGAVQQGHLRGWVHGLLFWLALVHYIKLLVIEHRAFGEINDTLSDMSQ